MSFVLPDDDRPMVTVAEAAAQMGVSKRTIYYWMAEGKVEWRETAGGTRRIVASSLWRTPPQDAA